MFKILPGLASIAGWKEQRSSRHEITDRPDFSLLEHRVFSIHNGSIYVGREELTPELRDLLKEQARYISTSQFWEILNATITNEASDMALKQSTSWEHVQTAKMLFHWGKVMQKMLNELQK